MNNKATLFATRSDVGIDDGKYEHRALDDLEQGDHVHLSGPGSRVHNGSVLISFPDLGMVVITNENTKDVHVHGLPDPDATRFSWFLSTDISVADRYKDADTIRKIWEEHVPRGRKFDFSSEGRRFRRLVNSLYESKNGNAIRNLVSTVAKAYEKRPEDLIDFLSSKYRPDKIEQTFFFNQTADLVEGIATSAYHALTGDIDPMQNTVYGGLGASISESDKRLLFSNSQLQFAKVSGTALQESCLMESALKYAIVSDDALQKSWSWREVLMGAHISGNAMQYAIHQGNGLDAKNGTIIEGDNTLLHARITRYDNLSFSREECKKRDIHGDIMPGCG